MTSTTMTIANRILENLLAGDGCRKTTRLGIKRHAFVARIGSKDRDGLGNVIGWTFADGSSIEENGSGWDTPAGWASNT